MGRPISYNNDLPKVWYSPLDTNQTSQHLFDMYSFTHVTHGILFFIIIRLLNAKLSFELVLLIAVTLEAIWEVCENTDSVVHKYRSQTISLGYVGDSIANSLADMCLCVLGVCIAAYLPPTLAFALAITSEIALLFIIRDNMTLNLMQLVYPIKWIKKWQAGG